MQRKSITLKKPVYELLRDRAEENMTSVSFEIQKLLEADLSEEEKEKYKQYKVARNVEEY